MTLSQLGEFELIRRFARLSPKSGKVVLGIGDDTATVVPSNKSCLMLLTCDPVIEGVHFNSSAKPYQIGWKVVARNLSDIAAMGGVPLYALVSASLPRHLTLRHALEIHRGIMTIARKFGVAIVGGDTARSPRGIHVTVTMVGEVARSELLKRSGARAGDVLCVTGTLGASILGKHLRFQPRLHEARFLAQRFRPSAMMDVSDGLASDLRRLAEQSRVGFEVWAGALPVSPALRAQKLSRTREIHHALCDGEDYELLFTMPSNRFLKLQAAWKKRFRLRLTQIGVVHPCGFGIQLVEGPENHKPLSFPQAENDHFRR